LQHIRPKQLLELAAVHAFEGIKKIGCRIVNQKTTGPMDDLLNNAWTEFWNSPATYHQWERQFMDRLKQQARQASTIT
jgi:hypothetical protein